MLAAASTATIKKTPGCGCEVEGSTVIFVYLPMGPGPVTAHDKLALPGSRDNSLPIFHVHQSNGIAIRFTLALTSQSTIHNGLIRSGKTGSSRANRTAGACGIA